MKRMLFAALILLLTAVGCTRPTLSREEWESLPPETRDKIERMLIEARWRRTVRFDALLGDSSTYVVVVADGQVHISARQEIRYLLSLPRDRQIPADGNYVYNRWCDQPDVSATYISPDMFGMMKRLPEINILGRQVDLSGIIPELKGLYLLDFARYSAERPWLTYSRNSSSEGLRRDIRDFLDENHYTTWMDMRQDGMYTRLFIASDGTTVSGFVLVNLDDEFDYGRFVCLEGRFPQKEFEKILKETLE